MNLFVTDTNARDANRVHDILIDGRIEHVTFEPGKKTELVEAKARKFVGVDGFIVEGADSKRLLPVTPITTGYEAPTKLGDQECVARFDELTVDALLARCAPLPGGEKITSRTGKEGIVSFLVENRKARSAANMSKEPEKSGDDMTDAELDKLNVAA